MKTAILPTRKENFTSWYLKVIENADLAEHSESRGCMIRKPWGYEIWDNIRSRIDQKIKSMGCQNVYFPTLIPLHYLEKEAQHIDGFAKECAVVTHHGLKKCKDNYGTSISSYMKQFGGYETHNIPADKNAKV